MISNNSHQSKSNVDDKAHFPSRYFKNIDVNNPCLKALHHCKHWWQTSSPSERFFTLCVVSIPPFLMAKNSPISSQKKIAVFIASTAIFLVVIIKFRTWKVENSPTKEGEELQTQKHLEKPLKSSKENKDIDNPQPKEDGQQSQILQNDVIELPEVKELETVEPTQTNKKTQTTSQKRKEKFARTGANQTFQLVNNGLEKKEDQQHIVVEKENPQVVEEKVVPNPLKMELKKAIDIVREFTKRARGENESYQTLHLEFSQRLWSSQESQIRGWEKQIKQAPTRQERLKKFAQKKNSSPFQEKEEALNAFQTKLQKATEVITEFAKKAKTDSSQTLYEEFLERLYSSQREKF